MRKSDILAALEKIPGDPEIEVNLIVRNEYSGAMMRKSATIDRINEYPRPEIVVVEKQL